MKYKHSWLKGKLMEGRVKLCSAQKLDPLGPMVCILAADHNGAHQWRPGPKVIDDSYNRRNDDNEI
jgi:hypothetical protein